MASVVAPAAQRTALASTKTLSAEEKRALAKQLELFTLELRRREDHVMSLIGRLLSLGDASENIRRQLQFREENLKNAVSVCQSASVHILTSA